MKDNLKVVSVVGKPNIGKSTLINRICISKDAIVHEEPMITRDRKYYKADWKKYSERRKESTYLDDDHKKTDPIFENPYITCAGFAGFGFNRNILHCPPAS